LNTIKAVAVVLLLVGAISCSSAPPAPDGVHDQRDRAADLLKLGQQSFQSVHYQQALTFFLSAAAINTAVDDEEGMAAAWNSAATAQLALGLRGDALKSLKIAEQMAKASQKTPLILQVVINQVQADLDADDPQAAKARLTPLLPFPNTVEGAALWHALATVQKALGEIGPAGISVAKALAFHRSKKQDQDTAADLFLTATLQGHQNKWTQAKTSLLEALALDRKVENTMGLGQDWRALGIVDDHLDDQASARQSFERSQRIFGAAGLKDQQIRSLKLLLQTVTKLGLKDEITRVQNLLDASAAAP